MSGTDDLFGLIVSEHGGRATVIVTGEVDVSGRDAVGARLREVQSNGNSHVTVDMRRVEFIDVSGLHVLLEARARAQEHGHELTLQPSHIVQRLLAVFGLEEYFGVADGSSV
jgi:anti-anti-sigma factor